MTAGAADWAPRAEPGHLRRDPGAFTHPRDAGLAAASLALHLLLLAAFLLAPSPKAPPPPQERTVDVQVLAPDEFEALFPRPDPTPALPTPVLALPPELPDIPLPAPTQPPQASQPEAAPDATIVARRFLSSQVLADPRSADAKAALGQMLPDEKMVQLCAIEAMAQIAALDDRYSPDLVATYAMDRLTLRGSVVDAPGAAFRSGGIWYNLAFTCGLAPDLSAIASFEYRLGREIPPEDWEEHNLVAGRNMDGH
ncbi:DUF930 domain-containing protein [Oricola sp.]|uniref:DUF930 domain-containing protein n=1 Tax=Oricola sp. TaxID=1979950 RepID=UPI0025F13117|nr:DUF930 domain-containing protein [Oricola sp.]MCI5076229.1 DUF930 domain-containing protein [Oricola sp.]